MTYNCETQNADGVFVQDLFFAGIRNVSREKQILHKTDPKTLFRKRPK